MKPFDKSVTDLDANYKNVDPSSSAEAAVDFKRSGRLGEHHQKILSVICDAPLTNMQIAKAIGFNQNQVTRRVRELERRGLIVEAPRKMCPYLKRNVTAWILRKEEAVA